MSAKKYSIKTRFSQCKYATNKEGFLLSEIMMAITLFSFVVLATAKFCGQMAIWQQKARMYGQATTVIDQMIEKIKLEKALPPFRTQINEITITCAPWKESLIQSTTMLNTNFLKNFEWIEIKATWKTTNDEIQTLLVYTGIELL